jgi:tetratricopeptide (TPR) repeat protein
VARLQDEQRAGWQRGERPAVEDLLDRHPALRDNAEAVLDLIYNEVVLRDEFGQAAGLAQYVQRFPAHAADLRDLFDVHEVLRPDLTSPCPDGAVGFGALPTVAGYEILRELGRGGMGVVYLARQAALKRLVVLKMLRDGNFAGPEQLARFRIEAELLARLQHPNIVQIHEVGTHDGRPYLVLEYVEGGSLAERLAGTPQAAHPAAGLAALLAAAVDAAHQRGVVHRDLKPANVLLSFSGRPVGQDSNPVTLPTGLESCPTGRPLNEWLPKIADFGLAKRIEDDSGQTASGAILGTPSYMAPEQAAGNREAVGPATDVYALGAILYELLTGRPPFRGATLSETVDQVRHRDPVPPRQLAPRCPRDLETICLACLHKEPARRYATARALEEDLHRFLAGEPIRARRTGWWERGRKWVRRHPAAAALAAVSAAAVLALVTLRLVYVAALAQSNCDLRAALGEAERERAQAEANLQKALQAVEELLAAGNDKDFAEVPRLEPKRRQLLQKALALYQGLLQENGSRPLVRRKTGRAYERVGWIQYWLGDSEAAERAYGHALDLQRGLAAEFPERPEYGHDLACTLHNLGNLLRDGRRWAEAEPICREAVALQEKLVAAAPGCASYREELARDYGSLGSLLRDTDRPREAETTYRAALQLIEGLAADAPDTPAYRHDLAGQRHNLGHLLAARRPEEAEKLYDQALAVQEQLARDCPDVPAYRHELARQHHSRGNLLRDTHRPAQAEAAYRRAVSLHEQLATDFPDVPRYRRQLAQHYQNLAMVLCGLERRSEAEEAYGRAVRLQERLTIDFPARALYHDELAQTLNALARLLRARGDREAAEQCLRRALPHQQAAQTSEARKP